jgi:hypothetical protein
MAWLWWALTSPTRKAVDAAIAGCDAVLSALDVSYSGTPISVYPVGATTIIAAMDRHHVKRPVVVSSAAIDPAYHPSNSVFYTRIVEPYFSDAFAESCHDGIRQRSDGSGCARQGRSDGPKLGEMAERPGSGLQPRLRRFKSALVSMVR